MFSTVVLATIFIGLLLLSVALWALFLRLGLRWAKVPDVTMPRVLLATVVAMVLHVAVSVLFLSFSPSTDAQSVVLGSVELGAFVVVPCIVIGRVFKTRFRRAIQAWLPTLLATAVLFALSFSVVRPFIHEAFVAPTNTMAPTLVGPHWSGTCRTCGHPTYCSPQDERYSTGDPPLMICDQFHVEQASSVDELVHSADWFVAAKFLAPRRWDLVVFKNPENPSVMFVKRLVGLPGEEILIQDGSVWADGKKQTPPDSVLGVEYLSELPHPFGIELWGSINRPALLDDDEYFVLGDFSVQSSDSRLWQRGASGHNPFAVPRSHIKGVVTHTYWPPSRWRVHR